MTLSRTHQETKPDEVEALRVGLSAARVEAYAQRVERQRAEAALAAVRLVCNQIESMPIPVDACMSQTEITGRVVSTIIKAVRAALVER